MGNSKLTNNGSFRNKNSMFALKKIAFNFSMKFSIKIIDISTITDKYRKYLNLL